ncbi:MAG: hypothetical protein ACRDIX_02160 [Actinomycetota bacterium]
MTGRGPREPGEGPGRAEPPGAGNPEPVESADVQEFGLGEPHRAMVSASLGLLLGTALAELARRAGRNRRA